MLCALWSPKGGSGTSVVTAALAVVLSRRGEARLVDLAGDQPAILGLPPEPSLAGVDAWMAAGPEAPVHQLDGLAVPVGDGLSLLPLGPGGPGGAVQGEAGAALAAALRDGVPTVADAGVADAHPDRLAFVEMADTSVVVVRGCYLALRRAVRSPLLAASAGVVLVDEPGRALGEADVAEILERPVLARFPVRASIARAVDAGVLWCRLPGALATPAEALSNRLPGRVTGRAA